MQAMTMDGVIRISKRYTVAVDSQGVLQAGLTQ